MSAKTGGKNPANALATAALMVVILIVAVVLATMTDLAWPARWLISVLSGILAAGVTYAAVSRRK